MEKLEACTAIIALARHSARYSSITPAIRSGNSALSAFAIRRHLRLPTALTTAHLNGYETSTAHRSAALKKDLQTKPLWFIAKDILTGHMFGERLVRLLFRANPS